MKRLCVLILLSELALSSTFALDGEALATVTLENRPPVQAAVRLDETGTPRIPVKLLTELSAGLLAESAATKLAGLSGDLDASGLAALGISMTYDPMLLSIRLSIAPQAMAVRSAGGEAPRLAEGTRIAPAFASLILDAGIAVSGEIGGRSGPSGTASLRAELTPAFRLGDGVLEGTAVATIPLDGTLPAFSFNSVRVVRDIPELASRLSVGMVDIPDSSFSGSLPAFGATVGTLRAAASGIGSSGTIILERPARVTVELNGAPVRDYRLDKGTWRLDDLPFSTGLNDVVIRIREEGKDERTIRSSQAFDPALLDPGAIDWRLSAGFDRADPARSVFSAYFGLGIAEPLQASLAGHAAHDRAGGEIALRLASGIGTWDAVGALAVPFGSPATGAVRLAWNLATPAHPELPRFGLQAEWRSAGFASPSSLSSTPAPAASQFRFGGRAALSLPSGAGTASVFGSASLADWQWNSWSAGAAWMVPVLNGGLLTVAGGVDWRLGSNPTPSLSLSFAALGPDASVQTWKDLLGPGSSAGIVLGNNPSVSPTVDIRARNIGASTEQDYQVSARAALPIADFQAGIGFAPASGTVSDAFSYQAGASSTFLFADGQIAMSSGGSDAYALLSAAPVEGRTRLSGSAGTTTATAPFAASISGVRAGSTIQGTVDFPDAAPDINPSPATVTLKPSYRSVTVLTPGVAATGSIRARLVSTEGSPLRLLAGRLIPNGAAAAAIDVFTDEQGWFEAYGVPTGPCVVHWSDGSESHFNLPAGTALIDAGDIPSGLPAGERSQS